MLQFMKTKGLTLLKVFFLMIQVGMAQIPSD